MAPRPNAPPVIKTDLWTESIEVRHGCHYLRQPLSTLEKAGPGNTLQSGRSGDNPCHLGNQVRRLLEGRSGPASSASGPALCCTVDGCVQLIGEPFEDR